MPEVSCVMLPRCFDSTWDSSAKLGADKVITARTATSAHRVIIENSWIGSLIVLGIQRQVAGMPGTNVTNLAAGVSTLIL
jgi:hypothetical protein